MATRGIIELLTHDHRQVDDLMNRIEKAEDEETCMRLFAEVRTALLAHSQAEDEVFYTRLEEDEQTERLIGEARDEHQQVEDMLEELGEIEDEDAWMERFEDLKTAVGHHVHQEEKEIFPMARKVLDREILDELGREFADIKQEELASLQADALEEAEEEPPVAAPRTHDGKAHAGGKHPGRTLDSYTKKELIERAKARGVEGYSHMTKAQLVEALRR